MSYSTTLPGGLTLHVLYISTLMATLNTTPRRRVNFFAAIVPNCIETGRRYSSGARCAVGFTTYHTTDDGDEAYKVTSIECGYRSDHLFDLADLEGPRLVSEANEYERQFARPSSRLHRDAEKAHRAPYDLADAEAAAIADAEHKAAMARLDALEAADKAKAKAKADALAAEPAAEAAAEPTT